MVNVTVRKDESGCCIGFRCDGHAAYAEEGSDIVCSAVSVLVINTINAIDAFTEDPYGVGQDPESGMIDFEFDETPSHDAVLLIDTMIMGLKSIEETYGNFIHLEIEEV